jgi:phosphatidylglycerol:prolipoprotein diacylglycerol transferase
MNFPVNFHWGNVIINSHLVFEILAYFIGFRYYLYLKAHSPDKITVESRFWIIVGGAWGAVIFSKLLGFLEHPELMTLSQQNWIYFLASKTIVGGLLGGILGVEITKKVLGVHHSSGDLFCFPIILGMIIGRIGCFLAGVEDGTHGLPTHFILGMDLGDGINRHPTALYEIVVLLLIWLGLIVINQHWVLTAGSLFKLFMVAYLSWRLGIEFLKPVHRYQFIPLSAIQLACVGGLMYYYQILLFPHRFVTKRTG